MNLLKALSLVTLFWVSFPGNASSAASWETFSDVGAYGLVGVALALPAYKKDLAGFEQAGYSVATASGAGLVGKSVIEAERPDKSGNDSFPSNHTASAFAAATTLNIRYGWEVGFPAYGIATLVGVGRVQADKHYWQDVVGGAVLGSFAAWLCTDTFDDNVHVVPWATSNKAGLTVSIDW